jgi:hypothetical protein
MQKDTYNFVLIKYGKYMCFSAGTLIYVRVLYPRAPGAASPGSRQAPAFFAIIKYWGPGFPRWDQVIPKKLWE